MTPETKKEDSEEVTEVEQEAVDEASDKDEGKEKKAKPFDADEFVRRETSIDK